MPRISNLLMNLLLAVVLAFSSSQMASAEISKSAYADLWTRTCKMAMTTGNIDLSKNELAIMRADLDNIHLLDSSWRSYYETKKAFGAKVPSFSVWAERTCRCAADYIAPRKRKLSDKTNSDLIFEVMEQCMN
jgi:hypothetical protein